MLLELAPMQQKLDAHVVRTHKLHGEDLYDNKKIALLVELSELANELRFFKYWSKDQEPRFFINCTACDGKKGFELPFGNEFSDCPVCWGTGKNENINPALEEYVDCVHLTLSICLQHPKYKDNIDELGDVKPLHYNSLNDHFNKLYAEISNHMFSNIEFVASLVLGLGELIGFSDEEIINAYKSKNKENFNRQRRGY